MDPTRERGRARLHRGGFRSTLWERIVSHVARAFSCLLFQVGVAESQAPADEALRNAGHEGIEKLNPPYADIPLDVLAAALNKTKPFMAHGLTITEKRLRELGKSLLKGRNSLASVSLLIYLSEIPAHAWLDAGDPQEGEAP